MMSRHIIDLDTIPVDEVNEILNMAKAIRKNPHYYSDSCHGKIMATLFYEPSTRTQMSFQAAMLRLGGQVIGFDNPGNSSVSKGESLKDTVKVVSNYADIIAIRHPGEGAAKAASFYSKSPVINAGDGGHLHPTQTLTDLFTLAITKGRLDNLTVGLCGDLLNGRTVHSLIKSLVRFSGNKFVLISTKELTVPDYIKDLLCKANCEYVEVNELSGAMAELDVLYMTRIQRERFAAEEEYQSQKGMFVLDSEKLKLAKTDLRILHPLPRVDEIAVEVDDDPRAVYFEQTEYGMYARMALILRLLEINNDIDSMPASNSASRCTNSKCITNTEEYLPRLFDKNKNNLTCKYCEKKL